MQPEQDQEASIPKGPSTTNSTTASDVEDGRSRTHHLYVAEPQADGLYHCPFETTDPYCRHEPAKLKCEYAYDPFRFPTS